MWLRAFPALPAADPACPPPSPSPTHAPGGCLRFALGAGGAGAAATCPDARPVCVCIHIPWWSRHAIVTCASAGRHKHAATPAAQGPICIHQKRLSPPAGAASSHRLPAGSPVQHLLQHGSPGTGRPISTGGQAISETEAAASGISAVIAGLSKGPAGLGGAAAGLLRPVGGGRALGRRRPPGRYCFSFGGFGALTKGPAAQHCNYSYNVGATAGGRLAPANG